MPLEAEFQALLVDVGLTHLNSVLEEGGMSYEACLAEASQQRTTFLQRLKDAGAGKLNERQKLTNALSKASKARAASAVVEISDPVDSTRSTAAAAVVMPSAPAASTSTASTSGRILAISDVHIDRRENKEWLFGILQRDPGRFENDALILAGDVTHEFEALRDMLMLCAASFKAVFFCPGNHDLWVISADQFTSLDKLRQISELCKDLGVHMRPAHVNGAIIVPILSWHHQSWDDEPDLRGWEGVVKPEQCSMDYFRTKWTPPLANDSGDSIAKHLDMLNDRPLLEARSTPLLAAVEALRAAHPSAPVISCSHFVPRVDLQPEKRFLFTPALNKTAGSSYLRARVEAVKPSLHVFGHTHFGWDATLDGVRYIQAALGYPKEREMRLPTIAIDAFPYEDGMTGGNGKLPHANREPFLTLYEQARGFAPRYVAAWSDFYDKYPRQAHLSHIIPQYVASRLKRVEGGPGEVGWGPGVKEAAWQLGPRWTRQHQGAVVPMDTPH